MSDDQNIWDDSLLIKTYDESINLARETLARRIADATNKRELNLNANETELDPDTELQPQQRPALEPEAVENAFKVGDFARATYTDGLDYEGTVMSIDEKTEKCILRYVGYENEQEVPLGVLLPSWGTTARRTQILAAQAEAAEDQQQQPSKTSSKKSVAKGKKAGGGRLPGHSPGLAMPPMPLVPPMFTPAGGVAGEPEQDFVAMLTAWYMSGYYTGLYQGKKEGSAKKKTSKK